MPMLLIWGSHSEPLLQSIHGASHQLAHYEVRVPKFKSLFHHLLAVIWASYVTTRSQLLYQESGVSNGPYLTGLLKSVTYLIWVKYKEPCVVNDKHLISSSCNLFFCS